MKMHYNQTRPRFVENINEKQLKWIKPIGAKTKALLLHLFSGSSDVVADVSCPFSFM